MPRGNLYAVILSSYIYLISLKLTNTRRFRFSKNLLPVLSDRNLFIWNICSSHNCNKFYVNINKIIKHNQETYQPRQKHFQMLFFPDKADVKVQYATWKSIDIWSLTCCKSILKISHSNCLQFYGNLQVKFAIFLKSTLPFNSFYSLLCL